MCESGPGQIGRSKATKFKCRDSVRTGLGYLLGFKLLSICRKVAYPWAENEREEKRDQAGCLLLEKTMRVMIRVVEGSGEPQWTSYHVR